MVEGRQNRGEPISMNVKIEPRKFDRRFQVWEYQVSHGQLLIRSPQAPAAQGWPECLTNIDLVCIDVDYMSLPRALNGVELVSPTSDEIQFLEELLGKSIAPSRVGIVASDGKRFPIVALSFMFWENDWEIFQSPFEFRSHYRAEK